MSWRRWTHGLAVNVVRWPSLTRGRLAGKVDAIVARVDADAVRRRKERHVDRQVWIGADQDGISEIHGSLFTVDAHALDKRLNALAATVCEHDSRTKEERRADALGALAAGADRLGCRCGRTDCAAGKRAAPSPVTIHVIAEQATLRGRSSAGLRDQCRRADHSRAGRRTREVGQTGPAGPPGLRPTGTGLHPVEGAGRFRARPGLDLPVARLRRARGQLRHRPYDPLRCRRGKMPMRPT